MGWAMILGKRLIKLATSNFELFIKKKNKTRIQYEGVTAKHEYNNIFWVNQNC